ncbi:MAG: ribonuclease T [Coxiellaceae bacterium]|nr:ribonuclease T [Coxiellaceae bacterium]
MADTNMTEEAINPPQMNQRFHGYLPVVVDIETGGVNPQTDAVLEIAAVFLKMETSGLISAISTDAYHVLPFEGACLHDEAMEIHGIDPYHPFRLAKDEPVAMQEFYQTVANHVKKAGCRRAVLVGHNAHFDLSFLNQAAQRCNIKNSPFHRFTCFDTATLSALRYGKTVLAKALEAAKIPFDKNEAHSALYDAERTAELFCKIINETPSLAMPAST